MEYKMEPDSTGTRDRFVSSTTDSGGRFHRRGGGPFDPVELEVLTRNETVSWMFQIVRS